MKDYRDDTGKGLMHADEYRMTKILVLTKVVLMTIIPMLFSRFHYLFQLYFPLALYSHSLFISLCEECFKMITKN